MALLKAFTCCFECTLKVNYRAICSHVIVICHTTKYLAAQFKFDFKFWEFVFILMQD